MVWHTTDWTLERLAANGQRAHVVIQQRRVTVVRHVDGEAGANAAPRLYCIDSSCGHAAGPLGAGVVADIEDIPCIRCPWHNFLFALDTGERVHRDFAPPPEPTGNSFMATMRAMTYPLQPVPDTVAGSCRRGGRVEQRVFPVELTSEGVISIDVPEVLTGKASPYVCPVRAKRGELSQSVWDVNPGKPPTDKPTRAAKDAGAMPKPALSLAHLPSGVAKEPEGDDGGPPGNPRSATPPPE